MSRYSTYIRRVVEHVKATLGVDISHREFSEGSTRAPVMIVGWQHGEAESKPFIEHPGNLLRMVMGRLRVGGNMALLTNLIKTPTPAMKVRDDEIACWVDLLDEQIAIVQPTAVILLGQDVARHVLHRPNEKLEEMRQWRFMLNRLGHAVTFFVTYTPAEMAADRGVLSFRAADWINDLRAVFDVDDRRYGKLKALR